MQTNMVQWFILASSLGCGASSVEVGGDGDIVSDDSVEDPEGDDAGADAGSDEQDGSDEDEGDTFEGEVEIVFERDGGVFCRGEGWFFVDAYEIIGEGECVLQAGPGEGEVIPLIFEGEGAEAEYDGTVSSDWVTPEGRSMEDADFQARTEGNSLTIEWESTVPTSGQGGGDSSQADVTGRADANSEA